MRAALTALMCSPPEILVLPDRYLPSAARRAAQPSGAGRRVTYPRDVHRAKQPADTASCSIEILLWAERAAQGAALREQCCALSASQKLR